MTKTYKELLEQAAAIYFCDSTIPEMLQFALPAHQNASLDCGLFGVPFSTGLAIGNNPETIYDQCEVNHLLNCLQSNKVKLFPRFNRARGEEQFIDITNHIENTNKQISPNKFSKLNSHLL